MNTDSKKAIITWGQVASVAVIAISVIAGNMIYDKWVKNLVVKKQ